MFHEKIRKLAHTIVNYSLSIKKGEKFLIEVRGKVPIVFFALLLKKL